MVKLTFDHKINRDTFSSIFFRIRQLCSLDLEKKNLIFGGPGKIVEIDFTTTSTDFWYGPKKRFDHKWKLLKVVPNREDQTLIEIFA